MNHDTEVNGLDVDPFADVLLASRFDVAADMNLDGQVNGLDVDPFVAAVVAGGARQIPDVLVRRDSSERMSTGLVRSCDKN